MDDPQSVSDKNIVSNGYYGARHSFNIAEIQIKKQPKNNLKYFERVAQAGIFCGSFHGGAVTELFVSREHRF